MVENEPRYKLLAWHLITFSREHEYTLDEFRGAISFLFGWSLYGEREVFKRAMLAIAEQATKEFFVKDWEARN